MNNTNISNELTHYGILGMKWGKRKGRSASSANTKKTKKPNSLNSSTRGKKITKGVLAGLGTTAVGALGFGAGLYGALLIGANFVTGLLDVWESSSDL